MKLYNLFFILLPLILFSYISIEKKSLMSAILSIARRYLFMGTFPNAFHLWYLLSLIIALIVIRFLITKEVKFRKIIFIGLIICFFGYSIKHIIVFGNGFNLITSKLISIYIFIFGENGSIFTGIGFISLGFIFKKYESWFDKQHTGLLFFIFLFGMLGSIYFSEIYDMIFSMMKVYSIFLLSMKMKNYKLLKNQTMDI